MEISGEAVAEPDKAISESDNINRESLAAAKQHVIQTSDGVKITS